MNRKAVSASSALLGKLQRKTASHDVPVETVPDRYDPRSARGGGGRLCLLWRCLRPPD